jgi:mono/diheme cytochrome c family protein
MRVFDQRIAKPTCTTGGFSLYVLGLTTTLWLGGCGAVFTEIPELDTADGRVFAQRCAACHLQPFGEHGVTHGVPDPRFRTMEEWQKELSRMEGLMLEKRLPSLTDPEREAIIRYLSRHAKSSSG